MQQILLLMRAAKSLVGSLVGCWAGAKVLSKSVIPGNVDDIDPCLRVQWVT